MILVLACEGSGGQTVGGMLMRGTQGSYAALEKHSQMTKSPKKSALHPLCMLAPFWKFSQALDMAGRDGRGVLSALREQL